MFVVKLLNMHESALCVQWYVTAVHPSVVLVCKYSRTGSDRQVVVWIESASMRVCMFSMGGKVKAVAASTEVVTFNFN